MSQIPDIGRLVGKWPYRSFLNNEDLSVDFDKLEFGRWNQAGKCREPWGRAV
jgi:hypothetical protein